MHHSDKPLESAVKGAVPDREPIESRHDRRLRESLERRQAKKDRRDALVPGPNATLRSQMEREARAHGFGETGEFPEGKLEANDQGELQFGLTIQDGVVLLNFGKPVEWLGMPPEYARSLAHKLLDLADKAEQ